MPLLYWSFRRSSGGCCRLGLGDHSGRCGRGRSGSSRRRRDRGCCRPVGLGVGVASASGQYEYGDKTDTLGQPHVTETG